MHLVPPETIIQEYPVQRTFADMRKDMVITGRRSLMNQASYTSTTSDDSTSTSSSAISIGCGSITIDENTVSGDPNEANGRSGTDRHHRRRRLVMVDSPSACNNSTNFYCWMSCLDIPDAEHAKSKIEDGLSLYCAEPATLDRTDQSVAAATKVCNDYSGNQVIIGGAMNTNCIGIWQPTADNVPATPVVPLNTTTDDSSNSSSSSESAVDDEPFCYGGTSMYMDGFHWLHPVCVIYLFPAWILSTAGAMIGACFGTIAFGIALEGIIRQRRDFVAEMPIGWKRLLVSTVLYGAQLTAGYMIMLVVMTYSGPLFLSVIIGLMGGHFLWNMKDIFDTATDSDEDETNLGPKSIDNNNNTGAGKSNTSSETVPYESPNNDEPTTLSCCCPPDATDDPMDAVDTEAVPPCCSSSSPDMNGSADLNNATTSYGATSSGTNGYKSINNSNNKKKKKKNMVPEGCTPCCQNAM